MIQRIPAWLVGFSGASIVLLSTAISSTYWQSLDAEIQSVQETHAELGTKITSMWNNHKLADVRVTSADQFFGLLFVGDETIGNSFFLNQIGLNLRGATLAMMIAAGKKIPDVPQNCSTTRKLAYQW